MIKRSRMAVSALFAFGLAGALAGFAAPASAAPGPLDQAAAKEASNAFMAQRQICGDKIVTVVDVSPPPSGGFAPSLDSRPGKPRTIYNEAKGVEQQFSGQGAKLNEADRLNGLQWKGRMTMVAKASREIAITRGGGGPNDPWSQWHANVTLAVVDVERRNGVWATRVHLVGQLAAMGQYARLRQGACSEVPA